MAVPHSLRVRNFGLPAKNPGEPATTHPQFTEVVFKRQDRHYDLLHIDAIGSEHVLHTYATLLEIYEAIYHEPRSRRSGISR